MRAVIYLRVSDVKQKQSGLGLEAQEAACRAWAARQGAETPGIPYQDVAHGDTAPTARKGLTAALASVGKGDVLLVAKRDRLSRDPYYMMIVERALLKQGARLVSAAGEASDDNSPTGVLMRRILDAFAEFERLMIGVRTTAALGAKRARGEYCGGNKAGTRPVGERVLDGKGKPLPRKVEVTGAVVAARVAVSQGRSLREASRVLARHGFVAPSGKPYSASVVARMVREVVKP